MGPKKVALVCRVFLGGIFTVFGLNGFLQFMSMPPMPEVAMGFMGGLMSSGYFLPVLKIAEITCGVLLLANIYAALALLILAPIVLNIVLFHLFLAPGGLPLALFILVLELALAWTYRSAYQSILSKKTDI